MVFLLLLELLHTATSTCLGAGPEQEEENLTGVGVLPGEKDRGKEEQGNSGYERIIIIILIIVASSSRRRAVNMTRER